MHKTEVKCFNNINKNHYVKYQHSKHSGMEPKYLPFTNKLSSSALGYNHHYLFDKPGHFALVSTSSRSRYTEMYQNVSHKKSIHIYTAKSMSKVGVNKLFS